MKFGDCFLGGWGSVNTNISPTTISTVCYLKGNHDSYLGPMIPYTPLNIANIRNMDLLPSTPSISSDSC